MTIHEGTHAAISDGNRRLLLKLGGLAGVGLLGVTPAWAGGKQQSDDLAVFNFALNLEYLEAEYYLRAVTGQGIPNQLTGGVPANNVTGGSAVPFRSRLMAQFAQTIANDELAHVAFIRNVLGANAIPEPVIDLTESFTTLAQAAGLIQPGQSFDPFSNEVDFLLGAYIFEDVGATAYAGAATSLSKANLPYAASILATESYHAGAIRAHLAAIGKDAATDAISALRQTLGTVEDHGVDSNGNRDAFTNVDANGLVFRRTPAQVLSIVYGGGTSSGLFFPNGLNGAITSVS